MSEKLHKYFYSPFLNYCSHICYVLIPLFYFLKLNRVKKSFLIRLFIFNFILFHFPLAFFFFQKGTINLSNYKNLCSTVLYDQGSYISKPIIPKWELFHWWGKWTDWARWFGAGRGDYIFIPEPQHLILWWE